jgi:hypothetical protein
LGLFGVQKRTCRRQQKDKDNVCRLFLHRKVIQVTLLFPYRSLRSGFQERRPVEIERDERQPAEIRPPGAQQLHPNQFPYISRGCRSSSPPGVVAATVQSPWKAARRNTEGGIAMRASWGGVSYGQHRLHLRHREVNSIGDPPSGPSMRCSRCVLVCL